MTGIVIPNQSVVDCVYPNVYNKVLVVLINMVCAEYWRMSISVVLSITPNMHEIVETIRPPLVNQMTGSVEN